MQGSDDDADVDVIEETEVTDDPHMQGSDNDDADVDVIEKKEVTDDTFPGGRCAGRRCNLVARGGAD